MWGHNQNLIGYVATPPSSAEENALGLQNCGPTAIFIYQRESETPNENREELYIGFRQVF